MATITVRYDGTEVRASGLTNEQAHEIEQEAKDAYDYGQWVTIGPGGTTVMGSKITGMTVTED